MSRIAEIYCVPFEAPYRVPLRMKAGDLFSARHVLVTVRLESGVEGIAEAPERPMFYGETLTSILAAVSHLISPRLAQMPRHSRLSVASVLRGIRANQTARAAVEMAYVDALAREAGVSVAQLLGGTDVPVRVTHMLGAGAPTQMAEEAHEAAESGVTCFKVKIGYGEAADATAVAEVRRALGDDALLYVDGNLVYSADDAARILQRLRDESGIAFAEEPYSVPGGLIERPPAMPVPVMVDESAIDFDQAARHIASGRAQKISIKVARTGYAASSEIISLGKYFGCNPVIGSQGDGIVGAFSGLAFASANILDFEPYAELNYFTRLAGDIVAEQPEITDGHLSSPGSPGIGVTVDADKLAHYRIEV